MKIDLLVKAAFPKFPYLSSMIRFLLIAAFAALCVPVAGQSFHDGWMYYKGDTMKGQLADAGPVLFFRLNKMTASVSYAKKNVSEYSIGEERYRCQPVDVMNGKFVQKQFLCLELEVRGTANLWLGVGDDVYGNPWDNYYVDIKGYQMIMVRKGRPFRKQMSWYFADHKDLSMRIRSGELGYEDLGDIVREYNSWAAGKPQS